jgi:hypothetical protein
MEEHIRPLRLFDLSQSDIRKKPIELSAQEQAHLADCVECQRVVDVFKRQFKIEKKD